MAAEVEWSEDEEAQSSIPPTPPTQAGGANRACAEESKQSLGGVAAGDMKKKDFGVGGGGRSVCVDVAPRGKSWMVVTQRMMETYSP